MATDDLDMATVPYELESGKTSPIVSSSSSAQTAAEEASTEIMGDQTTSQKANSPKEAKEFELAHGSKPEIVTPDRTSISTMHIQSPPPRRKATYQSQYSDNHNHNMCSPFPYPSYSYHASHSYHPSQYIMNYHDAQCYQTPLLHSPLHIPVPVQVIHHYVHNSVIDPSLSQAAHNSYMTPEKVSGSRNIQSRPQSLESRLVSTEEEHAAPLTHISPENLHPMGQGSIGSLSVGSLPTLVQQPQRRGRRPRRGRVRRRRSRQQSHQIQHHTHLKNSEIQDATDDFLRREKSLSFDSDVDNTLPSSILEDSTCDEVTIPE
ncbi:predicted protein [Chaetoceros tenuissimus]|uniref:Uncharacterized protein n=1 Tax=Chaetoceros tenuissimus TaxID=426638 RepID=A0AAD3H5Z9_9STRA|nr:predicted protein [Chaetoceros tenuissimus]